MPYYPERTPETSGEERRNAAAEKRQRLLRLSVAVFCALLVLYGAVRLILYGMELNDSRATSSELRQIQSEAETGAEPTDPPAAGDREATAEESSDSATGVMEAGASEPSDPVDNVMEAEAAESSVSATGEASDDRLKAIAYPDNPEWRVSERFRKLRQKGKYIIGWLSFDEVDEAVCLKDNTYFLNHDATGKKNSNGAIFLDSGISLRTRPYTLYLYGHNMKSGNMFGRLRKYEDNTYFYRHRIISFDSLYEEGEYAVFAVMEMDTVPGTARWYNLWSLDTDSASAREEAIRNLERRSVVNSTLDVRAEDQLLLLITCLDGDNERLIVAARRLRDGETKDNLHIRSHSNTFLFSGKR